MVQKFPAGQFYLVVSFAFHFGILFFAEDRILEGRAESLQSLVRSNDEAIQLNDTRYAKVAEPLVVVRACPGKWTRW